MAKIADGLGSTIEEAAVAVLRVGDAAMVNALKLISVQRGHDPRNFVLIHRHRRGRSDARRHTRSRDWRA